MTNANFKALAKIIKRSEYLPYADIEDMVMNYAIQSLGLSAALELLEDTMDAFSEAEARTRFKEFASSPKLLWDLEREEIEQYWEWLESVTF